ncbi:LysR family transcriptional regulator [Hwanghaeella sp.]|uniref:LysR family transcriptional regulator n=1 Tax=Hwanghaeella sp. TaxID=2605943 RepID=UPI003CCC3409
MINARQLEVLSTVIEVGTTARAAELLNVSQPAVSNMLRHTESITGLRLFKRDRGRLIATPEARHLANEAKHLFMQQQRIRVIVEELREGATGSLTVVASPSLGLGVLSKAMAAFARERPKLRLSLELGSIDEITDMISSGRAELGFSITTARHPSVSVAPVADGRLVCVIPHDHPFTTLKKVRIIDLNAVPSISYSALTPLGQLIDGVFSRQGLERRYACEVRHTATALEMAAGGLGPALIDNFALIGRSEIRVEVKETDPVLPIRIFSLTPKAFPTSQVATTFLGFFRNYLEKPID